MQEGKQAEGCKEARHSQAKEAQDAEYAHQEGQEGQESANRVRHTFAELAIRFRKGSSKLSRSLQASRGMGCPSFHFGAVVWYGSEIWLQI